MRVAIGCDHAGLRLKGALVARLEELGHEVHDLGTHGEASVDYPDFAHLVAARIVAGEADRGVLVCGTGQGMAMAANKVAGIRAGCVSDPFSARMIVEHNDAQIITFGQRTIGEGVAIVCLEAWLSATFAGGRHANRVARIDPTGR